MNGPLWQRRLAVLAVALFFTNLAWYLPYIGVLPFPPVLIIAATAALASPLWLHGFSARVWLSPLNGFCVGWMLLSAGSFFYSSLSPVAVQSLESRLLAAAFLVLLGFVFSGPGAQLAARRAVLWAVLLGCAVNFYELLRPNALSMMRGGRAAGAYLNPNVAGGALVMGMMLSLGVVKPRLRPAFALLVGVSLLPTFSRSAIVSWAMVSVLLVLTGVLSVRRGFAATVTAAWAGGYLFIDRLPDLVGHLERAGTLGRGSVERALWFLNPSLTDARTVSRVEVVELGWRMFLEKPVLGHGIGATSEWASAVGPHNTFVLLMVEHGFVGLFVLPLLVAAVVWRARGEARRLALPFAAFTLFWGTVSHNMLVEVHWTTALALMAAMSLASRPGEGPAAAPRPAVVPWPAAAPSPIPHESAR